MLRNQRGMIVKHVDGSLDDFIDQVFVRGIPYYRDKAQDMIRYMAIEFVLKGYRMIKTSGNPVLAAVCLFPGWLLYMRYYRKN